MNKLIERGYMRGIFIVLCALIVILPACAHETITIFVPKEPHISIKEFSSLAVAPFLSKNDSMEINERCAEELVYALQQEKFKLDIIALGSAKRTLPLPGETIQDNEDYFGGWKRVARENNADLLICGVTEFKSNVYSYYETRSEFDMRTGRSRPVRYQMFRTAYYLLTTYRLINLRDDTILLEKDIENSFEVERVADEDNIYIFYDLMDKSIKEFLAEVKPGKSKSVRYIL